MQSSKANSTERPPQQGAVNPAAGTQVTFNQNFLHVAQGHPGSLTAHDITQISATNPSFGQKLQDDLFLEMEHQRAIDLAMLKQDNEVHRREMSTPHWQTLAGMVVSLGGFLVAGYMVYLGYPWVAAVLAAVLSLVIYRALGGRADPKKTEGRFPGR